MKAKFKTSNLSNLQVGKLNKALDRLYRFSEGTMSLREFIEEYGADKKTSNPLFNRSHFNRLNYEEQQKYENNLKKTTYDVVLKNGHSVDIPKMVYDSLYFE